jgi:asparagine synthase (glutamine-hydrolysing)
VLVTAYHAWGSACLHRCFGMFAFALWDAPNRRLFCARDRFGVKPFYYAVHDGEFAFASEIKAVRSLLPACGEPDLAYVFAFLHSGRAVDAPRTPFARIHELPGGCTLTIEHGVVGQPVRWYDIDLERARASYDYDRPEAELLRLMHDSVRLRLRADVPVGTCLSGGLDSSGIVALATAQLRETLGPEARMNSFSAVYPVAGMDESRYVDLVAETYRTIAHRVTPTSDAFLDQLARITWHQDIPTGTSGVYTQHFVMQLAQGRVTVLLDGQGADELFGGYLSYVVVHLDALRRTRPAQYAREMAAFMAGVWGRFNASLNWREFGDRVLRYVTRRPAASVLAGEPAAIGAVRAREVYNDGLPYGVTAPVGSDALNRHLYRALMRESIPALLHYEDRNSMAYSIEARVPYLDHRLAEFALGLPAAHKIRAPETKRVMRRAFAEVLPPAITQRKDKLGYPTPLAQWLRGPLRQPVHDYLHEQVLRRGWYDADAVRGLWAAHTAARANHERAIYRMLTAEMWMQQAERPASLAVAGHALPIG